jgi:uncharacterized protein YqjF (DUF2071 family)
VKQPGRFLSAEWNNLAMLNYVVDAALLGRHVPSGTELDSFEGRAYVSLIGFEFNRTRVLGVPVPLHRSFKEVNLRLYVRRGERRGVAFIRELVPRYAVAAIARAAFGENYRSVPMAHRIHTGEDTIEAEYEWGAARNRCAIRVEAEGVAYLPAEGSVEQFITEHYWGYSALRDGRSLEYEVQHPQWPVRKARRAEFTGDAKEFCGSEFAKILEQPPDSAFFAAGSTVTVFKGTRIH